MDSRYMFRLFGIQERQVRHRRRTHRSLRFRQSKTPPRIGVLNRYYGVMESGKIKVRGLEVRRRDTPRFVFDAQTEMINTLAQANDTFELRQRIHDGIEIVKAYRQKMLDGEIDPW